MPHIVRIQVTTTEGELPIILARQKHAPKKFMPIPSFCRASIRPGGCPLHVPLGAGMSLSGEL